MDYPLWDQEDALKRALGKEALLARLVGVFLEDAPNQVSTLREAVDSALIEDIVSAAHTIKGVAANLGATRLSECAKLVEFQAREGDTDALKDALPLLFAVHEQTCETLQAYLN